MGTGTRCLRARARAARGSAAAPLGAGLASVGAYTVFQMLQNLGSGVGFFLPLAYPMHDGETAVPGIGIAASPVGTYTLAYLQFAMLAVGLAGFFVVDLEHVGKARAARARRAAAKAGAEAAAAAAGLV